jgi:hypothetical protein
MAASGGDASTTSDHDEGQGETGDPMKIAESLPTGSWDRGDGPWLLDVAHGETAAQR